MMFTCPAKIRNHLPPVILNLMISIKMMVKRRRRRKI